MTLFQSIPIILGIAPVVFIILEILLWSIQAKRDNRRNVERIKRKYAEHKAGIKT